MKEIDEAIEKLSKTHAEHIAQYGSGNELRLTGKVTETTSLPNALTRHWLLASLLCIYKNDLERTAMGT